MAIPEHWIATKKYVRDRIAEDSETSLPPIPAGAFGPTFGSPSLTTVSVLWSGWLFDAASIETIAVTLGVLPADWSTVNVDLYWTNVGAGSGDVVWRCVLESTAEGGDLSAASAAALSVLTAPAQDVLAVDRIGSALSSFTAGDLCGLRIFRQADSGSDTLGNDAALLGVLVSKAS